MNIVQAGNKCLASGNAARYIKPSWREGKTLLTQTFDLREGPPPERYVSHYLVDGEGSKIFNTAYNLISRRLKKCNKGSIAIIDIAEALIEINDEAFDLIKFVDADLPHCGLVFVTTDEQKILEAKTTLCYLAEQMLSHIENLLEMQDV